MTNTKPSAFDLDAILGELEPKPLTYRKQSFTLPAELPGAVIAPFLADDLGLIDLISEVVAAMGDDDKKKSEDGDEDEDGKSFTDMVFDVLKKAPTLPKGLIDAATQAFRDLLDAEDEGQFDRFQALKPSVNAYLLIARGLFDEYGVGLTDFFGSDEPSENTDEDSKPTSPTTTQEAEKQTSEVSSDAPETPVSSE